MEEDWSTKFTVIPVEDKQNQLALQKYVTNDEFPFKASLCRFYLRGMCILKKEYCQFAHGMDQIGQYHPQPEPGLSQKERKKKDISRKSFFNQKGLFFCPLSYHNLYEFNKATSPKEITLERIDTQTQTRNNLRLRFHKYHWQRFIEYLQKKFPDANITVPWLSAKFTKYGFCKPHTHCKLHMILFWIEKSNFYIRHQVILPPMVDPTSIVFKRYSKRPFDKILHQDYTHSQQNLTDKKTQKLGQDDRVRLNQEIIKQYAASKYVNQKTSICKFYMKGLCMFSEQECKYCHSFQTLRYFPQDQRIGDQQHFHQKALFSEPKLNYVSLYAYQQTYSQKQQGFATLSIDEINESSQVRQKLRQAMHDDIYLQFLNMLAQFYPGAHFTLSFLRRQYNNTGLNKTKVDKFPSFVQRLQTIGYEVDSFIVPPCLTIKKQYAFKRPSTQELDRMFDDLMVQILVRKLEQGHQEESTILTQTLVRKRCYEYQSPWTIALHRYLKLKGLSFREFILHQLQFNQGLKPYLNVVSFDLKQNVQKIRDSLREFYSANQRRVYHYGEIQSQVRKDCGDSVANNLSSNNLKWYIIRESLGTNKQIYTIPNSEIIVIDKAGQPTQTWTCPCNLLKLDNVGFPLNAEVDSDLSHNYRDQRVVVVQDDETLRYAKMILRRVDVVGVDMEGSLKEDGYVYLVQFGTKNPFTGNNQVLVFDIWAIKKNDKLMQKTIRTLKYTLQNANIVKVMHDCKNDSVAMHYLLGSCLYPVFDTSAMQTYLDQKELNQSEGDKEMFMSNLFKIHNKSPGLNQILQRYQRPVNSLKQYMRKIFESEKDFKALYFQARPINPDFLQYAVRDVQQLVDVYRLAVKSDTNSFWKQIGLYTSTLGLGK